MGRVTSARERIGMTINNYKVLDCRRNLEKGTTQYLVHCLVCQTEKWVFPQKLKTSPKKEGCRCNIIRGAEHIGKTINNYKVLDFKRDQGKKTGLYLVYCLVCTGERWITVDTLKRPLLSEGCCCNRIVGSDRIGMTVNNYKVLDFKLAKNRKSGRYLVHCLICKRKSG